MDFKGGNSRQLSKTLDALDHPAAILDRRGQIVFVNAALCGMVATDATQLVGKQCSWDLVPDNTAVGALLNALAPPAAARNGGVSTRVLSTPVVFGAPWTGQLFLPLLDNDQVVALTLVLFGEFEQLSRQLPSNGAWTRAEQVQAEQILVATRSRWAKLDGLHALLGDSPAIRLAMSRAQLAASTQCNVLLVGPEQVGKSQVARGLFNSRLETLNLPAAAGQFFPIDCGLLDAELVAGMLEVFAGRLRPGTPAQVQQLVLEHVNRLTDAAVGPLVHWIHQHASSCTVTAIGRCSAKELSERSDDWQDLMANLSQIEITIPALAERGQDIPALAQQALAASCRRADRALLSFSPEALDLLIAYAWPRNLHQLNEAIDEAVAHAVLTTTLQIQHLPVEIRTFPSSVTTADGLTVEAIELDQLLEDVERIVLRRALKLSPRNRAQVARWLSISRPRLLRRIDQLGLDQKDSAPSREAAPESDDDANPS